MLSRRDFLTTGAAALGGTLLPTSAKASVGELAYAAGAQQAAARISTTDLAGMRVGQRAEIRFDAFPDVVLRGHVASIGAGTGSEFSVLPAQNATGNWVKVTQRVPVRIAIDEKSPRELIAGLSTDVTVFTDGREH